MSSVTFDRLIEAGAQSNAEREECMVKEQYVRPEILVTYTENELVEEAAVCVVYDPTDGIPT
jgi:hypothetical protein